MSPSRVVPAFDVAEERDARFSLALEGTAIEQFALETGKEALRHRVVVGVADAAHGRTHAELCAALTERDARVLRTLIAMVDDTARPALRDRHVKCTEHQVCRHLLANGP